MSKIRRLVLDVIKPLEPSIIELAKSLAELEGINGVNIGLIEVDRRVENVKVVIEGSDIPLNDVFNVIESFGGAVHSIDEVVAGKRMVEQVMTPEEM